MPEPKVWAYANHGRWVADCVRPYCRGAEKLDPGQAHFYCTNCEQIATIIWPSNADEIWAALAERPVPQTRNWFPRDHPLALAAGCEHGQTVQDLRDETAHFTALADPGISGPKIIRLTDDDDCTDC